jgi:anti-sigma-K factor RskA
MERSVVEHPELEQAAAYALDALDAGERSTFEVHLAGCPSCRAEVAELRSVSAGLAYALPAESPPPALRERVLAEARMSPRRTAPEVIPLHKPSRFRAAPWLAAAASLVLALGLGWQLGRERDAREGAERQLAVTQTQLEEAGRLAAGRDSLLRVVLSPAATTAKLAATGQSPTMQLVCHRTAAVIVLSHANLPPAASGRTYQLWGLTSSGSPKSLGTFNTFQGPGYLVMRASPDDMAQVNVSAVTEEPAGGSPQPTSQPILVGNWATR